MVSALSILAELHAPLLLRLGSGIYLSLHRSSPRQRVVGPDLGAPLGIPMPLALPSFATLADWAFALRLVAHARRPGLPRHDDSACQLLVIAIPASPSRDGFLFSGHVLRHP